MTQLIDNAGSSPPNWMAAANWARDLPVPMDFTPPQAGCDPAPLAADGGVSVLANPHGEAADPDLDLARVMEEPQQCDALQEKLVGVFIRTSLLSSGATCDGYGVDFEFPPKDWRFGPFDENRDYDDYDTDPRIRLNDRETEKLLYDIGEIVGKYAELVSCTGAIRADRIFATDLFDKQAIQHVLVVPKSVAVRLTDYVANPDHFFRESFKKGDFSKPALLDVSVGLVAAGHAPIEDIFESLQDLDPAEANANFGGSVTPDRMPRAEENCAEWANRVCVSEAQCDEIERKWIRSGRNPTLMMANMTRFRGAVPKIEFLVDGLIPMAELSLLVATAESGKSTLMAELACKVQSGLMPQTFLGADIFRQGQILIFSGEGGPEIWAVAITKMGVDPEYAPAVIDAVGLTVQQCVDIAKGAPDVVAVIFDPSTNWIKQENDDTITGEFMRELGYLARQKRCAVIAVHHPKKVPINNIAELKLKTRGHSVFIDRPRMVLGMIYRGDGLVDVGIVKSNVGYAWGNEGQARRFRRNTEKMTLEDARGATPAKHATAAPSEVYEADFDALVVETVSRLTPGGRKVRRTGDNSVYSNRAGALARASRKMVEQTVDRLISNGGLQITDGVILHQNHAS